VLLCVCVCVCVCAHALRACVCEGVGVRVGTSYGGCERLRAGRVGCLVLGVKWIREGVVERRSCVAGQMRDFGLRDRIGGRRWVLW